LGWAALLCSFPVGLITVGYFLMKFYS
jgi:hypothetical protein